jgi:release factor glutamine methyltransferase
MSCVGITEEQFFLQPEMSVSAEKERTYRRLLKKRLSGRPLAYLLGYQEFWSLKFRTDPRALIPRPETELLVEKTAALTGRGRQTIVDLGTGCGNIAVCLAKELPRADIIALDISSRALCLARSNASLNGISRIVFRRGDLFAPLKKLGLEKSCDFIVSNPPYVTDSEWPSLQVEIRRFEPKKALVAGKTGLEIIRRIIDEAPQYLKTGGHLILEIGYGQKESVISLFESSWSDIEIIPDLNKIPRVICARLCSV